MESKPTILLIHGAWHTPACMDTFRQILQARGFESVCPALPTMGPKESREFRKKTCFDDVQVVRDSLTKLLDEGKDVLVAAHSYGGQVMTEAIRHEYSKTVRSEKAQKGGVLGLVFICAFLIPEGKVGQMYFVLPRFPFPFYLKPHIFKGYSTVRNGAKTFYQDLPEAEAKKWEASLICSSSGHAKPTTYAAQRHHRSLYIHCNQDRAIVPDLQKYMIRKNREVGIQIEREVELDSGHSPFLSMPERLADEVLGFLET